MIRRMSFLALILVGATFASEPGEPLGGEDWVMAMPGLVGRDYLDNGTICGQGTVVCDWQRGNQVDTLGRTFYLNPVRVPAGTFCDGRESFRQEIHLLGGDGEPTLVAYLEDRCVPGSTGKADAWVWREWHDQDASIKDARFSFDVMNGVLRFSTRTVCAECANPNGSIDKIVEISGFTTTFEILQTYTPTANNFGFRVPYMPEGLPASDWFDTYWGDLATVGDWSQARPLQCGYPSSAPAVGDYLEVADVTPTPDPGTGHYYVTAANYQGERRFGRQGSGGELAGRDPQALPDCVEPQRSR